jgi:hypothetical protein
MFLDDLLQGTTLVVIAASAGEHQFHQLIGDLSDHSHGGKRIQTVEVRFVITGSVVACEKLPQKRTAVEVADVVAIAHGIFPSLSYE